MATRETITALIVELISVYPKDAGKIDRQSLPSMAANWSKYLSDIDDDLLAAAVDDHITHSQWFPAIAELRKRAIELMRQASPAHQTAIDAWGSVVKAIAQIGSYGLPEFDNPITAKVISRMGWINLCMSDSPMAVDRAQFERYYESEMRKAVTVYQQTPRLRSFVQHLSVTGNGLQLAGDVASRLLEGARDEQILDRCTR